MTHGQVYNNIDKEKIGSNFWGMLIFTIIAFCLNPLVGMAISFFFSLRSSDKYELNQKELMLFMITVSAWISLINCSKFINGDQVVYTKMFLLVPKMGFIGTLFDTWGTGKEPVYSLITYILYYVTFGSPKAFYFILSFAIYFLNFLAVYTLYKHIKAPKGALLCGILILTFFSQYFVMTLQLIRQFLAASVVIYALVWRVVKGNNNWWLLAAAVLIHTSAIFIAGLSLIAWFYKWMPKRRVYTALVFLGLMVAGNTYVAGFLGSGTGIEAIDYGLERYGTEGLTDALDGKTMPISIMLTILIPLTICSIVLLRRYKLAMDKMNFQMLRQLQPILPFVYIYVVLMVFVLSFGKSPLIQYRFFYYTYSFLPILLPLLFAKIDNAKIFWVAISSFLILRFFITFDDLAWKYPPVINLFYQPITYYFSIDTIPVMENFYEVYE